MIHGQKNIKLTALLSELVIYREVYFSFVNRSWRRITASGLVKTM